MVPLGEASFPSPFKSTLEFNAPAHGTWNIVHTGMLIPESHQIYICPANCMRGVVLTAAEMNAQSRFSQVLISERDVLCTGIGQLTVDGVCGCLEKLARLPEAVLVFTVCIHHFMGADLKWIYKELSRRFPDVTFIRCFMDPIMRKSGLTPDEKIRKSLYEPVMPLPVKDRAAAIVGGDFALDESSDLKVLLRAAGFEIKELALCSSYEEYLATGECGLLICCYPPALKGARALAKRLERPLLYLPLSFYPAEIEENGHKLICALNALRGGPGRGSAGMKEASPGAGKKDEALNALKKVKEKAKDIEIDIDSTFHPRVLGLARLLLERGFNVRKIYLDAVSAEEEENFYYLKEHYPGLLLCATVHPKCALLREMENCDVLALGQKAAWFTRSRHFVNIVEGAGWYGYDGIIKLAGAMTDALENEKDPAEYITLKGLGCESCVQ